MHFILFIRAPLIRQHYMLCDMMRLSFPVWVVSFKECSHLHIFADSISKLFKYFPSCLQTVTTIIIFRFSLKRMRGWESKWMVPQEKMQQNSGGENLLNFFVIEILNLFWFKLKFVFPFLLTTFNPNTRLDWICNSSIILIYSQCPFKLKTWIVPSQS